MYFAGIIIVIVLNTFFYYDQMQNNKEIYKTHRKLFNFILFCFFLVEVFILTIIYHFTNLMLGQ